MFALKYGSKRHHPALNELPPDVDDDILSHLHRTNATS